MGCFHGATAEPNQLKPKSKLSDKSFEPKLKPGSTKPNNDSSTKSLLLQPELPTASTAGRPEPSLTSARSTNNSSAVLTTNAKIASYTTCLETRKTEQRAKLVEWLN